MKTKIYAVLLVLVLVALVPALAGGFYPLPLQSQAHMGATHMAVLKAGDMATATTTNGPVTNVLFTAQTYQAVDLVAMTVPAVFDTGRTNGATVSCGDTNGATQFMTASQIGPTSTVYVAYGNGTNTGAVATLQAKKVYTQATAVRAIFTPDTSSAAADFTKGEVRFYFRIFNRND